MKKIKIKQSKISQIKTEHIKAKIDIDYNYRKEALKRFRQAIKNNERFLLDQIKKDLNKQDKESYLCEINEVLWEIDDHIKNLKKWMKTKKVKKTVQTNYAKSYLVKKPKGRILIICPFNYPFNLSMMPLVGAISAGNQVLVKTSEHTPNTNKAIYKILDEAFDKKHVAYVDDKEINNYNELYDYEPNLVFFTGSTYVGKIIEKECVNRNIEYVTELGGQCPCFVQDITNDVVYRRIVWAKWLNAGQTCVSINHIFYNKSITNFKDKLINELDSQYHDVLKNHNIVKIINKQSFERLVKVIKENKSSIIYGGKYDEKTLIIEPTIIEVDSVDKIIKYGEIFGPILFLIKSSNSFEKDLEMANTIDPSPLASYLCSMDDKKIELFINKINSGSYAINDAISQILNNHLPFGGTYTSGTGVYHGKYSFDTMSFTKPILINKSKKENSLKYFNQNGFTLEKTKKKLNFYKKLIK